MIGPDEVIDMARDWVDKVEFKIRKRQHALAMDPYFAKRDTEYTERLKSMQASEMYKIAADGGINWPEP